MSTQVADGTPTDLRIEYERDPMGLDETRPRLSWRLSDRRRGATQTAWHVLVASSLERLDAHQGDLWDSRPVASGQSLQLAYGGSPLVSRQSCWWKVRIWDHEGSPSAWSAPARWEMGLLAREDWSAAWIGRRDQIGGGPCAYLRTSVRVRPGLVRARAYATALGFYELWANGKPVTADLFNPGWTAYRRRVLVQTRDLTPHLVPGDNVIGATVADGWYCGALGPKLERNNFGAPPPRLLLQLELAYADGSTDRVVTGEGWRTTTGPILSAGLYEGERYDARLDLGKWSEPGYDDSSWAAADLFPDNGAERSAFAGPPILVTEEVTPIAVSEPAPGIHVYDLGQNIVGFCRLRLKAPCGTEVRLRHAEFLRPDGQVDVSNLRLARATDSYIACGCGVETWQPRFTYHGFRYVEVTGMPGAPDRSTITGLVVHSDAKPAGTLETSSDLVNRLLTAIRWGQRGNMHSVVTDCPQRDERLGWMGDAQIFARTSCFNMDMAAFYTKFARDMADSQTSEGAFSDVSPYVSASGALPPAGAPGWMEAGVVLPWVIHLVYGDRRILERHLGSMAQYVEYLHRHNPAGLWEKARGNDYGDWVPAGSVSDKTQFATLHYFLSADLTARSAEVVGDRGRATWACGIADLVRQAFNNRWLKQGRYEGATQTVNALALGFGIVPPGDRRSVAEDLVRDIEARGGHLSTGFGGTQWLLPALSETGYDALAHRLVTNRDYPSWGYMLEKGATTIWERWNADKEGPKMNSHNHFAYGSVGEWIWRYLVGLDTATDRPGFAHLLIQPHPAVGASPLAQVTRVKAAYDTHHGRAEVSWDATGPGFSLDVTIPPNTTATVRIPALGVERVTESGRCLTAAEGIRRADYAAGHVTCEVTAGSYCFRAR